MNPYSFDDLLMGISAPPEYKGACNSPDKALTADTLFRAKRLLPPRLPPRVPEIIVSRSALTQFRFPRSKKKRIRAKWAKRPQNKRPAAFRIDGRQPILIVHPAMMPKI